MLMLMLPCPARFTGFSEESLFLKKNLKYGQSMDSDAVALNFLKKLDPTSVLERLDFLSDMM